MKAVILVGGLGTRLKSVVQDIPKPMAKVNGRPFLEYLVLYLKKFDITDIVLAVSYKREKVWDYFGDGKSFGVKIEYALEKEPLGTGGGIKNAQTKIKDDFLVLNGDSFVKIDIQKLVNFHRAQNALLTLSLRKVKSYHRGGFVELRKEQVVGFDFEDKTGQAREGYISAGVYVVKPEIFKFVPKNKKVSFEKETTPKLLRDRQKIAGFKTRGYFIDIGTPESYNKAQVDFKKMEKLWL